jgi:hypothetical protein
MLSFLRHITESITSSKRPEEVYEGCDELREDTVLERNVFHFPAG